MAQISTTNGTSGRYLHPQELPPSEPGKAYTLQSLCGEIIYIPCSKSALRLLVTGKESENAFALVGTGGSESPPIGFHFHREAHDVFLCLQGSVNVWAEDQCRTMNPGDFASVPPGVVHQYQVLGDYTEFIGLIVPGGWEEFFRFIGEPYAGPMWPLVDTRNPFEVLIPKLKAAAEKFDMVPQPHLPYFPPQPWNEKLNSSLPGKTAPYFLQANKGPKYLVEGVVVKPLATTKESAGKFAIGSIEGSSWHSNSLFQSKWKFEDVHHAIHVTDGEFTVTVDDQTAQLKSGETIYLPKQSTFNVKFSSRFAKAYVFASGGGLVELLCAAGGEYQHSMLPEKEEAANGQNISELAAKHGCSIA